MKEGAVLCSVCEQQITMPGVFLCPGCGEETAGGRRCTRCIDYPIFAHMAAGSYTRESLLADAIEAMKYQYIEQIGDILHRHVAHCVNAHISYFDDVDVIVPVSLHRRRHAERGFNQADIIATMLGEILSIPIQKVLVRTRPTQQQASLGKNARIRNVKSAFVLKSGSDIISQRILLVDDVYTTGSTMHACAVALEVGEPSKIRGFSLARGMLT